MIPFSYKLAFKYILNAYSKNNLGAMIKICCVSIIISTFSFAVILSIMNGFDKGTKEKLQGINSDLIIQSPFVDSLDYEKIDSVLTREFGNYIQNSSPQASSQIIIKGNSSSYNLNLVAIKGVDFDKEKNMNPNLSKIFIGKSGDIFIGEPLAKQLSVKEGDMITLMFPESEIYNSSIKLQSTEAKVAGLFKLGINEFDEHVVFSSISFLNNIFDIGVTAINVNLFPKYKGDLILINNLKRRLNLDVLSWQDLYPALVSALVLEKYAMALILFLVLLIASMNVIALLYMFIIQKRVDIAILKSLGMRDRELIKVFTSIGVILSCLSTIIGIILAIFACFILNNYCRIELPDIYYISYLHADFEWVYIPIILFIVFCISFIVSYITAKRISSISVTNVLKDT